MAKYQQHTKQARNVTAQPTFDTLLGHESHPQCHATALQYAVTSQVCTHLNTTTQHQIAEHKNPHLFFNQGFS